jgi:hypothetical protein
MLKQITAEKCEIKSGRTKKTTLKNISKLSMISAFVFELFDNQNEFFDVFTKKKILINRI